MMYISAPGLALALDSVQRMSMEKVMTGWFSGIDQEVLRMLNAFPELREPHKAFENARYGLFPRELTIETWDEMKRASSELAVAVRKLGDIDILQCERMTTYGSTCKHALDRDGRCLMTWHTIA